jgi:ribosome-associated protein
MSLDIKEIVKPFTDVILERKAQNVIALDVRNLTSYTDFFIICTGRSGRQVSSIAEHIKVEMKKKGERPIAVDGMAEGQWVLLDYGNIIIHVFYEETRAFYDLEGLWADAEILRF